jgi:FAD/FMN-containing dehydrogenase
VVVVSAGARLPYHSPAPRAARGWRSRSYPSNLGGTLVGWFVTGGIGMNAFAHGRALQSVKAADVLLPAG